MTKQRFMIRKNEQYMTNDETFGARHVRGTTWNVTKRDETGKHVAIRGERFTDLSSATTRMWELHG